MKGLENYESVKARKKRFYKDYEDGRIIVELVKGDTREAVMCARLFKSLKEQSACLPLSSGYAQEFKGEGGFANTHAHLENCEESAIGRALDNAGYATNEKCSREEMIKVFREEEKTLGKVPSLKQKMKDLGYEDRITNVKWDDARSVIATEKYLEVLESEQKEG